jgi:hypothetical protein
MLINIKAKPVLLVLFVLTTVAISTIFFIRSSRMVPPSTAGGPRIELPFQSLNLGSGRAGQVMHSTFRIFNRGSELLDYEILTSCGCTNLSPRQGSINKGASQEIQLAITLESEGKDKSVQITVYSNDRTQPSVTFFARSECPARLTATPQRIDFGIIRVGETPELTFTVRDMRIPPSTKEVVSVLARWDQNRFRVKYKSISKSEWLFSVSLIAVDSASYIGDTIRILFPDGDAALEVPVTARVIGKISIAPSVLYYSMQDNVSELSFRVWRPDRRPLGPLMTCSGADEFTLLEQPSDGSYFRRFLIRRATTSASLKEARILLRFRDSEEAAVLHVRPVRP